MYSCNTSRSFFSAAIATAICAGAVQMSNAAIITNGDFQSPETGTDNLTNVTPDAWTAVEPVDVLQVQTGDGSVFGNSVYSSGDQFVYFNAAGRDPGGAVFQTFATVTGAQYTVSFQLGHMFNLNAGGVAGILGEVFDGAATSGTALGSLTDTRAPIGENALVSFEFTAASGTSTLVFTDVSTGEDNIDTGLDNVSVVLQTAPEPSTFVLAVLSIVGLWVRRRRRACT